MANQIKQAIFRGKKYKIIWSTASGLGQCEHPSAKGKKIILNPTLKGKELIRVAVDEGIHACCWDLGNDEVGEMSESISKFLWELGVRVIEKEQE
jgi:hypothetical protein